MNEEPRYMDIDDMPEVIRLAEEVRTTRVWLLLQADGRNLAIMRPLPRRRTSRRNRGTTDVSQQPSGD